MFTLSQTNQEVRFYTGITNDLVRRIYEHRNELANGFSKTYKLKILVFYEVYDDIVVAIKREKQIKHWNREWKVSLIENMNSNWVDLYNTIV